MAQDSFPWGCSPNVGDAGAVTVNDLVNAQQFTGNTQPNEEGVVYWTSGNPLPGGSVAVDGLLEASLVGDVVSIDTGVGMVQGWFLVSDAVETFDFAADAGNANATDLIVLERRNPATSPAVRLARVKGAASTVATVTQSESLWQVAIAQVALDGSGLPTAVTDVRRFVGQVMSWRQGGAAGNWDSPGATNYLVGNVEMQSGSQTVVIAPGGTGGVTAITFPKAFADNPTVLCSIHDDIAAVNPPIACRADGVSDTGFSAIAYSTDNTIYAAGAQIYVSWLAIGLR